MKRILLLVALTIAFAAAVAFAAGTVTQSAAWVDSSNVKVVTIDWTADASNADVPDTVIPALNGYLLRVVTKPHTNSTIQPQDNYDLRLLEHLNGSLDLFNGMGMNRDTANDEQFFPHHNNGTLNVYPVYSASPLTLEHTNSTVNSATGRVILYVDVPK